MLKIKIIKKDKWDKIVETITTLRGEKEVLSREKYVLQSMLKDEEAKVALQKKKFEEEKEAYIMAQEEETEARIEKLQKDLEHEKNKHIRYVEKQKRSVVQKQKKWLNAYPDEKFEG